MFMEGAAADIARRLEKDFIFGTATSSWQIEGNSQSRGASIWDDFAGLPGKIKDGATADPACDHINKWREDVDLLSWLSVDSYRFSFSWPRIQPGGQGEVSKQGLAFYDQLIDELLERNIQPNATIYHWDLPSELGAKGGWVWDGIADTFAQYTQILASNFSDRISRWATFNEPWCSAFLGYADTVHAPGAGNPAQGFEAAYRLLLAHGRSIEVLRSHGAKELGIVLNLTEVIGEDPEIADAVRHIDGIQNRLWLDPLSGRGIPQDVIDRTSNFVDWSFVKPTELNEISTPIDWLGINYYTPQRIGKPAITGEGEVVGDSNNAYPGTPPITFVPRMPQTEMGWEIAASSLKATLKATAKSFPNTPLFITENGGAFPDANVDEKINDLDRIDYFSQHINAALDAKDEGANLQGYFAWSLLDNIEWAEGWTKRFGIVHVDLETQFRTPKASAEFIRAILQNRRKS